MHQTFYCISKDICEGFLYSLEGIKQWDWSQVSATCPKSHFDTSTCLVLETSLLDFSSSLYYISKFFCDILRPDESQSILYPHAPPPPPYLYPFLFQLLPFAFPIIMYHYTLIIFLSDPIKDLKYTIPPPDPPNPHFFSFSPIIYALIPALIFIPHYNTWSYTVLQNSPPPSQPIPIPCPCLPPPPHFIYLLPIFLHAFESHHLYMQIHHI